MRRIETHREQAEGMRAIESILETTEEVEETPPEITTLTLPNLDTSGGMTSL